MTDTAKASADTIVEEKPKVGGQILIDALLRQGVEVIFGYPGGAILPVFDFLYHAVEAKKLKFVLPCHEQGGTHMADGYARASGKVGVVLATSGPGATNLATGLATALMDGIPMVAITGQVPTTLIGNDAFQEADTTGVMRPITKHTYLVKDVHDLGRIVAEAFHIASTGKPGPVLIDLPKDVSVAEHKGPVSYDMDLPGYKPTTRGNPRQIERAAKAINASERPLLYTGGGIISSNAAAELFDVATKGNIPVTTTLMGLGGFPETHNLSVQMLGMHGCVTANYAVCECDLLIAVGARFDDRVTGKVETFAPNAKIIHVDVDPSCIGKIKVPEIPIVGDAKWVLGEMAKFIEHRPREAWLKQLDEWKAKYPFHYHLDALEKSKSKIMPQAVIQAIYEGTKGEALIATGVGQHQMWSAQYFKYTWPRQFLTSGGLGTMGFGIPAAIGAAMGRPDRTVWCIDGDGCALMTGQEMHTAALHDLPVKVAILNNDTLGMVRQWQDMFYGGRRSQTEFANHPDFVKLAEAYHCKGILVTEPEQVASAIAEANTCDGPVIVEFRVAQIENVFPMVPAGASLEETIIGPTPDGYYGDKVPLVT